MIERGDDRKPIHQVGLHIRPAKNTLTVGEQQREDDLDLGGSSGLQGGFQAEHGLDAVLARLANQTSAN